jgi:dTMP kinase
VSAIRGILPDVTFLLLVDPEEAQRRSGPPGDRIEREGDEFLREVDKAYRELGSAFAGRITMLDASRSVDEVAKEVRDRLPRIS